MCWNLWQGLVCHTQQLRPWMFKLVMFLCLSTRTNTNRVDLYIQVLCRLQKVLWLWEKHQFCKRLMTFICWIEFTQCEKVQQKYYLYHFNYYCSVCIYFSRERLFGKNKFFGRDFPVVEDRAKVFSLKCLYSSNVSAFQICFTKGLELMLILTVPFVKFVFLSFCHYVPCIFKSVRTSLISNPTATWGCVFAHPVWMYI